MAPGRRGEQERWRCLTNSLPRTPNGRRRSEENRPCAWIPRDDAGADADADADAMPMVIVMLMVMVMVMLMVMVMACCGWRTW
jgi:hypothetical protein